MSGFSSKFASVLLAVSLCAPGLTLPAVAQRGGTRKPAKKKSDAPPLPAYTPVPLQPLPLDQMPAVAPKVDFQDGQLSIQAHNSTLADVLRAVRKQTGAEFEIPPSANERVVADIGPGPARDVIAELLNGTHFNYVMVGSTTDPTAVQSIILTPRTGGPETAAVAQPTRMGMPPRRVFPGAIPPGQAAQDTVQTVEDNSADADDPPDVADGQEEQPPDQQNQGPQTPKTPEQLLQELQRQQQQQQQQQSPQQPQPQPGLFPNQPPTQQPAPTKPE